MIIGLSGKIKSGKTTAATMIKQLNPSFKEKYFAYKLKLICSILTGDDIKLFESQEGKAGMLEDWGITRRKMLQFVGTETLRNGFDQQIWVKSLFADYRLEFGGAGMTDYDLTQVYPNWIISDVRFDNEAKAIKEKGGLLIRVNRPYADIYPEMWQLFAGTGEAMSDENFLDFVKSNDMELYEKIAHPSEVGLDNYTEFDLVIENNQGLKEYQDQVVAFLKTHKLA